MSTTQDGRNGRRVEVGRTGARFGRSEAELPDPVGTSPVDHTDEVTFPLAVRGYDRRHIDHYLAGQRHALQQLQAERDQLGSRLQQAERRAETAAAENGRLRGELSTRGSSGEGYGARAEKLLRLAESEASQMRANASRETVALIEQARVQAELHRHETEQAVIARSRELEQNLRRRALELDERAERSSEQIASDRAESERLRGAVAEAATKLRDEAEAEAELVKARARAEAGRTREEARVELNRVTALRAEVHAELERINRVILGQLAAGTTG